MACFFSTRQNNSRFKKTKAKNAKTHLTGKLTWTTFWLHYKKRFSVRRKMFLFDTRKYGRNFFIDKENLDFFVERSQTSTIANQ